MSEINIKKLTIFSLLALSIAFILSLLVGSYLVTMISAQLLLVVIIISVLIQMYLRVQHHLDKEFSNGQNIIRNNLQVLLDIKDEFEKRFEIISNLINTNSQDNEKKILLLNNEVQKIEKTFDINNQDRKNDLISLNKKVQDVIDQSVLTGRFDQLKRAVPKIFDYKTVLYIGARKDRYQFLPDFLSAGYKISVLEIFKPNVEFLKTSTWIDEVIEGDVQTFEINKKYDIVFWWHGPEHISKEKLKITLANLEKLSKKYIVLGCPWGNVPQGKMYEKLNPNEAHVSIINTGDLEALGFKTSYFGFKDKVGSNIIAVKNK